MKKTLLVTIDKFSFNLTEDAFAALENYLKTIDNYLSKDVKDEIIKDVEYRIAEILLGVNKPMINKDDIYSVINEIGKPSDFGEEEDNKELHIKKYYCFRYFFYVCVCY